MPTLHLLMGLPGSGKTTLGKSLERLMGATRISSDEYRLQLHPAPTFSQQEHDTLYRILDEKTASLLQSGQDVIYDANLNRYMHRQEKYKLARDLGVHVQLWWVQVESDLARSRRLSEQDHLLLPAGETAGAMFDRIKAVFEAPKKTEHPILVDGKHITDTLIQKLLNNE